ncbi:MAG: hypothetical protein RQ936_00800 [Gammaproteobacteria bacterium]|nr:hypothetical protein [Gammaproteobacteria bacterium]
MNTQLHELVLEALAIARKQGLNQKAIATISNLDEVGLSRLKKADDAKFSTLQELGKVLGKKLIWVDDSNDLPSLVQKGELFDFR